MMIIEICMTQPEGNTLQLVYMGLLRLITVTMSHPSAKILDKLAKTKPSPSWEAVLLELRISRSYHI